MSASTPQGRRRRGLNFVGSWLGSLVVFALLTSLGSAGHWLIYVICSLAVCPIIPAVIAKVRETTPFHQTFDLKVGSWAFQLGDFFLGLAGMFMALGWHYKSTTHGWYTHTSWLVLSYVIGIGIAVGFHLFDRGAWRSQRTVGRQDAPSKLWHDWAVYPGLGGSLVFLGLPVFFSHLWAHQPWWPALALLSVACWALIALRHDFKGLDTFQMHGDFDYDGKRTPVPAGQKLPHELSLAQAKAAAAFAARVSSN